MIYDILAPAVEVFLTIYNNLPTPIIAFYHLTLVFMLVWFVVKILFKWGE